RGRRAAQYQGSAVMDVVLIDAGGTNIGSVNYALERLGVTAAMSGDAARIRAASHVILPGVGAAAEGMRRLRESGLDEGSMQLLFEHSQEGDTTCLGILSGSVGRLRGNKDLRVPHMGWNRLSIERDDPLLAGIEAGAFAYFVHGYAAPMSPATLASSTHGDA